MGAKMGSIWTGACLMGGFLGAYLADTYYLSVIPMMGNVPYAKYIAVAALFLSGVAVLLVPGWLISKIVRGFFLGIVDSLFGFVTGALAGLVALSLVFLLVLPHFPRIEKKPVWTSSHLVKPLHDFVVKTIQKK